MIELLTPCPSVLLSNQFFSSNGVSAVVLPAFSGEPTKIGIEKEKSHCFANEFAFSFSMNECRVPSMAIPTPVQFPESGVPTSVLMYGVDDRELFGLGLALEAALAGN